MFPTSNAEEEEEEVEAKRTRCSCCERVIEDRERRERTGRERAALKAVERAPLRPATFFRAPAGSLASILGMSTSRSSSTRIFERQARRAPRTHSPLPGEPGAVSRTNHSLPFCDAGADQALTRPKAEISLDDARSTCARLWLAWSLQLRLNEQIISLAQTQQLSGTRIYR